MFTVVVGDDSSVMRDRLRAYVRKAGGIVLASEENGRTTLAACYRHKPDLAIFDLLMPPQRADNDPAGPEALEVAKFAKVLISTSNSQKATVDRYRGIPNVWLIVKPYAAEQFEQKIKEIIGADA